MMAEDCCSFSFYFHLRCSAYDSCRDESMLSLQAKCDQLEENNTSLILEVWHDA
jgi:hypothetical protein